MGQCQSANHPANHHVQSDRCYKEKNSDAPSSTATDSTDTDVSSTEQPTEEPPMRLCYDDRIKGIFMAQGISTIEEEILGSRPPPAAPARQTSWTNLSTGPESSDDDVSDYGFFDAGLSERSELVVPLLDLWDRPTEGALLKRSTKLLSGTLIND